MSNFDYDNESSGEKDFIDIVMNYAYEDEQDFILLPEPTEENYQILFNNKYIKKMYLDYYSNLSSVIDRGIKREMRRYDNDNMLDGREVFGIIEKGFIEMEAHRFGSVGGMGFGRFGRKNIMSSDEVSDFTNLDAKKFFYFFRDMRLMQVKSALSSGLTEMEISDKYKIPLPFVRKYVREVKQSSNIDELIEKYKKSIKSYGDFRRFNIVSLGVLNKVRHILAVGKSGSGKSVSLSRIVFLLLDRGWSIVDINDSMGRLESAFYIFDIFDDKIDEIIQNGECFGEKSEMEINEWLKSLNKLRSAVRKFKLKYYPVNIVIYHPYTSSLPKELPDLPRLKWIIYAFAIDEFFDSLFAEKIPTGGLKDTIFGNLSEAEVKYLYIAYQHFKSENMLDKITLKDISNYLLRFTDETGTEIQLYDDVKMDVKFNKKTIQSLVMKLIEVHKKNILQPKFINHGTEEKPIWKKNKYVLDLSNILEFRKTIVIFSNKWMGDDRFKFVVANYVLHHILSNKRMGKINRNVGVLIREIDEFAGKNVGGVAKLCFDKIYYIGARGRDVGIRLIGDVQRFSKIKQELITNIHELIVHNITESEDLSLITTSYVRSYATNIKEKIISLNTGEVLLFGEDVKRLRKIKVVPPPFAVKMETLDFVRFANCYSKSRFKVPDLSKHIVRNSENKSIIEEVELPNLTKYGVKLKTKKMAVYLSVILKAIIDGYGEFYVKDVRNMFSYISTKYLNFNEEFNEELFYSLIKKDFVKIIKIEKVFNVLYKYKLVYGDEWNKYTKKLLYLLSDTFDFDVEELIADVGYRVGTQKNKMKDNDIGDKKSNNIEGFKKSLFNLKNKGGDNNEK